uniref:Cornifelin homolog B n=1 Tax=Aquarana catesbeiana TaxID=8400 RepID=C1C3J1_AQUCT|nr:Cornifelin homolog B [Aquarana catesbeiana]
MCLPALDTSWAGFSPVVPPVSLAMRTSIRERYKIRGSMCEDCLILYFCLCCTWCQMAREIKRRKQPAYIVTAQTTTVTMPGQNVRYPAP